MSDKKDLKPYLESVLIFIVFFSFLVYSFKDHILTFFPVSDNIIILVQSEDFNLKDWLTKGFSEYFLIYDNLSRKAYDFLRPVFNAITFSLYKLSNGNLSVFPLIGLFIHSLTASFIYFFTVRTLSVSKLSAFLLSLVFFINWNFLFLASTYAFVQDTLTLLIILITLLLYYNGNKLSSISVSLIGLYTKEQFLAIPVILGINEFRNFLKTKSFNFLFYAAMFFLISFSYIVHKYVFFKSLGGEDYFEFSSTGLLKLLYIPSNLIVLEPYINLLYPSFIEAIKGFILNANLWDFIGLFINMIILTLLIIVFLKRKIDFVTGMLLIVYTLYLIPLKMLLDLSGSRFIVYSYFFSFYSITKSFSARKNSIYFLLLAILVLQVHKLMIKTPTGGFDNLDLELTKRNEYCWEIIDSLKNCDFGGTIYFIGYDSCFMYGTKGVSEFFNLRSNFTKVFSPQIFISPDIEVKFENFTNIYIYNLHDFPSFLALFENTSYETMRKYIKDLGDFFVIERNKNILYVLKKDTRIHFPCKDPDDCRFEFFNVILITNSTDTLLLNEKKGGEVVCVPISTFSFIE